MNIKITKKSVLQEYCNSTTSEYSYLIHGKLYNDEQNAFIRFKFIISFDAIDYDEYLEEENLKASKKAFNDYKNLLIDCFISNAFDCMNGDFENRGKFIDICNDSIIAYNKRHNYTGTEKPIYNEQELKGIAFDLELNYSEYYATVYFDFIVEAVEKTLNDIHTKNLAKIHKHITENYI